MSCCFDLDALLRLRDHGCASNRCGALDAHARSCALHLLRSGVRALTLARDALSSST